MTRLYTKAPKQGARTRQKGVVLIIIAVAVLIGLGVFFVTALYGNGLRINRERITSEALAKAKDALLAYAEANRTRGIFPCPEDPALVGLPFEGNAQPMH
jgi:hypothetical protein